LEDVKDNSGRVIQDAPLELWANLKQRALDVALKEINKHSDIKLGEFSSPPSKTYSSVPPTLAAPRYRTTQPTLLERWIHPKRMIRLVAW